MTTYLLTLALTLAIELPLALLLAPRGLRRRVLAVAFFANLLTHPVASLLVLYVPYAWPFAELLAFAAEACAYRVVGNATVVRAIVISFVANLATGYAASVWASA